MELGGAERLSLPRRLSAGHRRRLAARGDDRHRRRVRKIEDLNTFVVYCHALPPVPPTSSDPVEVVLELGRKVVVDADGRRCGAAAGR